MAAIKNISISAAFNEQVSEPHSLAVSVASPLSVQSAYNYSGLRTNGLPVRYLQHSRVECAVKNVNEIIFEHENHKEIKIRMT